METIHVAFCCDDHYVKPLAVAVRSVLETSLDPKRLHVWLASTAATCDALSQICAMIEASGSQCTLLPITSMDKLLKGAPARGHITIAAYYRLFLPEILPVAVRRVIYLDCDVVVRRAIEDLWSVELGGHAIAAVVKPRAQEFSAVGVRAEEDYFNSGVLVIDTARWRAEGVCEKALRFAMHHPGCIHGHDQPALNHVFNGRWARLDRRWNQQFKIFVHTAGYLRVPRQELRRLRREPYVIHYTTSAKPWQPLNEHPLRRCYFEVLDRTPFRGWRPTPAGWRARLTFSAMGVVPLYLRPCVLRNVLRPYYRSFKDRFLTIQRSGVERSVSVIVR